VPAEELGDEHDPRVLVGMLEQAGLVRRGFDAGRALQIELLPPPADAAERMSSLLARSERQALTRADRIVAYAESRRCRQAEIAEHFGERPGESCGTCDRCAPAPEVGVIAFDEGASALPADVGAAILEAASQLRWPLGQTGLAAMLSGSVAAPPSARRSPSFGLLAAARPGTVKRWIDALVASGHLARYESEDGFPLLRVARVDDPPRLTAVDDAPPNAADTPLFERLRAWRRETAAGAEVPAFVVFSDRTLRALASVRPSDESQLAAVPGVGPAKLERYGPDLLAVIGADA
jgi:ATP-dependent DNA helicase RecQ